MSKCTGGRKKNCVDHQRDQSQLTYLLHGPGHSTDEGKVLNDLVLNILKT